MILSNGEKIFVVTRRSYEKDIRRHFIGEILEVSAVAIKVQGYVFVFDETNNDFKRYEKLRTCIFSLIDAGIVVTVLPEESILEEIRYTFDDENRRILTDGKSFKLNVSEFGRNR